MPLFTMLHRPTIPTKDLDLAVAAVRKAAADKLSTAEHDVSAVDILGDRRKTDDLGKLDVVFVFTLEAYPERVGSRDRLALGIAHHVMSSLKNQQVYLRVRVQLNLCSVGWSYL